MRKCLFVLLSILFLIGCATSEKENYSIIGSVPDFEYEGEWIYLVPIKGATFETVDSAQIENGVFFFKGVANTSDIRIIRMRPLFRLKLQELLIVVEPGELSVRLDSVSNAIGTPQNDALQYWKDEKMRMERSMMALSEQAKIAPSLVADSIEEVKARINKAFADYNYEFVKTSDFNTIGTFIYETFGHSFSSEQRKELDELKDKY